MMTDLFIEDEADEKYLQLEVKFNKACHQLKVLSSMISQAQALYDRAARNNKRSYRYTLRIRLVVLEGVRNMYYMYAMQKADELEKALQQYGEMTTTSDSSEEEEMEF